MAPLSSTEVTLVQDSWGNVEKRLRLDGTRIFVKMFEKYPDTKKSFPDFVTLSSEELKHNMRLKIHVIRVSTALYLLVHTLADEKVLHAVSRNEANIHHFRGVRRPEFDRFNEIFMEYISYVIHNPETLAAWGKAMNLITHSLSLDDPTKRLY
jgi:hemoglobin-like flavoprotein